MGIRRNAAAVSVRERDALQRAFAAMYGLRDERGYGFHAGLHGLPLPTYCEHGTSLFLPWHRAYVYLFERALQDRDPAANLPWWDWSSARAHAEGIPLAFRAGRLGGAATGNPLGDGPVTLAASDLALIRANLPGAITAGSRPRTRRDPDVPGELPRLATVRRALDQRTFGGFTALLEGIHNGVHGWVGGAMTAVPVAAYDPIFWAHHSMIDRLWYLWQIGPNGVDPPANLLDRVLRPFTLRVRDTLNISSLGYEYAAQVMT